MKLWSSVRQQANKLAFEADRMVRIKKEEGAIEEARKQITVVKANIGEVALGLFRAGSLDVPQVASLVTQIDEIEESIGAHEQALELIRAELAPGDEAEQPATAPAQQQAPLEPIAAPVSAEPVAPVERAADAVPVAEAPAERKCTNCGAVVPGNAAFCPECGTRQG